ncbi:NAD(P)-binding protein [Collybia nuda]|uniref:NAD(P)-binding protein n=1 Tax=Collybia nuda TaxID=64659 RepID=A0A9P5YGG0_9AGAR|nr:NAD(P)-binding protein [Collybia nuda]
MGIIQSFISEAIPPESEFSVEDIPDLTGKVIIVTGGNAGIGKSTVKALLTHNAKVYLAARNEEKAQLAIDDIECQIGKKALFLRLNLADLLSVKAAAQEFMRQESRLHVLFNNGGVMATPHEQLTTQGYDLQFGTNVLGHMYFTQLLLPTLLLGAKFSPDGKARVVTTSSSGHLFGFLDFSTFKDGPGRNRRSTSFFYLQSKFGNVVFANELARRYGDKGIVSVSLNPGNIDTGLYQHLPKLFLAIAKILWLYAPDHGALTQLWAGTSAEGGNLNGKYLIPWARIGKPKTSSTDPELGKQLWKWLEDQVENI